MINRFDLITQVIEILNKYKVSLFEVGSTKYHVSVKGYNPDPKHPSKMADIVETIGSDLDYTCSISGAEGIFNILINLRG